MAADSIQITGYEMLRPLGSGGMSTVYLALQQSLDRKVAIKIMRRTGDQSSADTRQVERRFLLEGRMMAKLPHRNIVAVYDIVSNDTIAYIAMEYLAGGALTERMRSGLSLADAVAVIVQISAALEFAHNHGVIHRDLKPANIMFRDSGTPVLTDFGIARYQDGSATKLTQTGMLVGTPTYMSPEQINGLPVDGRADQYSLGILFYELLTGAPPFRGDTPIAVLMAHLTQPVAPLPEEFRSFQEVFDRMLAKNRDDRYPNLKVFSDDLRSRLVHSDTLLMRLQIDPNLSVSEQWRALGFSASSTSGEGLREILADRLPIPTGPRPILKPATPTPAAVPVPAAAKPKKNVAPKATAVAVPSSPNARPKWIWFAGAGVALAIVAGLWWVLGAQHHVMNKDEAELVALWIERAEHRIESGQLVVAPAESDGSAYQYVQKILEKDPGNAKGTALLDRIVKQLVTQSETALGENKFDDALAFDAQALQVRAEDKTLLALKAKIEQARQVAAQTPAVDPAITAAHDKIEKVLAATSSSAEDLRTALAELTPLLAGGIDKDAPALRKRWIDAVDARLQAATDAAGFDAFAALLKDQDAALNAEPAYAALTATLPTLRAKIVAGEQAKLAATRGELMLNAYPWAKVETVLDSEHKPVTLPNNAVTPLSLPLPAGEYTITFRHPSVGRATPVTVKVEVGKRATATANFNTISAQEYFSRVGW